MTRFFAVLCLTFLLVGPWAAHAAGDDQGRQVYENTCATCHDDGLAGAPKLEDQNAWQKRLGKGVEVLVTHSIEGYQGDAGYMPPKGGNSSLSDAEIEAAVNYMIDQSKE